MALITGSSGTIKFNDGDSSNYVTLAANATTSANVAYTLPAADGSSGHFLSTNASGVLSWAAAGGGLDSCADAVINNGYGLIVGHGSQLAPGGVTSEVQVLGTADADSSLTIGRFSANACPAHLYFVKGRHACVGGATTLSACDSIGDIQWHGADGGDIVPIAARIRAGTDGATGANDMPGFLSFQTTADGAQAPTERMKINSSGNVTAGGRFRIGAGTAASPAYSFCGRTNDGIYSSADDSVDITSGGTQRLRVYGGNVFTANGTSLKLCDTADGNVSVGVTINQQANDNVILALKSSDVSHSFQCGTGARARRLVEADTYGAFRKASVANGGLMIQGYNDSCGSSFIIESWNECSVRTDKDSDSAGAITFHSGLISSNTQAAMNADANVLAIKVATDTTNVLTRFIFDTEGTAHADVGTATYDDYCDVELLRGMLAETVPCYKENYQTRFGKDMMYNLQWYEDNKLIGKNSIHWETRPCGRVQQRAMINFTGLTMLHHSTIIQMYDKLTARLDSIENRLALTEGR